MARKKVSETVTENIFRDFYGANTFIENRLYRPAMALLQKRHILQRLS